MQFEKRNGTRTEPWVSPLFKGQGDEEEPGTETAKEELMISKYHILKAKKRRYFKEKRVKTYVKCC